MLQRSKLLTSFFFISLYSIALETFLTRYFAVTNWAEYGYWIISIVMAGFAVSGVAMSLFEKVYEKHSGKLLMILPALLLASTVTGMYFVSINQFNPLEFQNEVTWTSQIGNIFKYYAALFPIFFILGSYIGLVYVRLCSEISKIYAINLIGSALGSVLILFIMYKVSLFSLPQVFTVLLAVPVVLALAKETGWKKIVSVASVLVFIACELYFLFAFRPELPFYKPLVCAMNMEGNKVISSKSLPEGYFVVIDNPTEYNNIDLSNNYDLLNMGPPPRSYGIYRDGRRMAPLMNELPSDFSYLNGALDTLPYLYVKKNPVVLLAGTNGGFRIAERNHSGVESLTALESDSVLYGYIKTDAVDKYMKDYSKLTFVNANPYLYLMSSKVKYDVIDISSDFIGTSDSNKYGFTVDAVQKYLQSVNDGGIISIPVSISEFTVHSIKMLETVRLALEKSGMKNPSDYVIVYRSNWTARILVSNKPFDQSRIDLLKKFCNDRSFDASYFPGIDPSKAVIWNDLPMISFDSVTQESRESASDAIMTDAGKIFSAENKSYLKNNFFDLNPSTTDKPSFFSVLRLKKISQILEKRSILPQEEIGYLINIFVLVQAAFLALVIMLMPLIRVKNLGVDKKKIPAMMVYFAALGLGFLFIEIALIERFTLFLNSSTASFAIVLTVMLIFSGAGSYFTSRFRNNLSKGLLISVSIIAVMCIIYVFALFPLIDIFSSSPYAVKVAVITVLVAPVSFALGMPFPIGLSSLRAHAGSMVPWGWAINGAFSVISGPAASIVSISSGYTVLFGVSIILYLSAFLFFPGRFGKK